jgi:hypothetical protein
MNKFTFILQLWNDIFVRSEAVRTAAIIIATGLILSIIIIFGIINLVSYNKQLDIIELQMKVVSSQNDTLKEILLHRNNTQKTKYQKTKHISK